MRKLIRLLGWLAVWQAILYSCGTSEETEVTPSPQYFIEAELVGELTINELQNSIALFTFIDPSFSFLNRYVGQLQYDVKAYKLTYFTEYLDGNRIEASGLVIVPATSNPVPLFSYHHGAIRNTADAPSSFSLTSESTLVSLPLASLGYVVAAPDYIGFGASEAYPHPYEHRALSATASRDMLRAVREFVAIEGNTLSGELFLAGYSQGGSVTMGLHQLIEAEHDQEFTLTASIPGAGSYNKVGFAKYLLTAEESQSFIDFYVWVLGTYNSLYGLNRPYSYYFTEPSASYIAATPLMQLRISELETNPQFLFTQAFREGVLQETDTELLAALQDNDTYNWRPQAPIRMVHGTADDFVPIFNAEDALAAMQANGASQVELVPVLGTDHFSTIPLYFENVLSYLEEF